MLHNIAIRFIWENRVDSKLIYTEKVGPIVLLVGNDKICAQAVLE